MRQKSYFKLSGLSKPRSFTCEPLHNDEIFWPKSNLTQEQFDNLWNYCSGEWSEKKYAIIEHDGLYDCGIPINPLVIGITLTLD